MVLCLHSASAAGPHVHLQVIHLHLIFILILVLVVNKLEEMVVLVLDIGHLVGHLALQ